MEKEQGPSKDVIKQIDKDDIRNFDRKLFEEDNDMDMSQLSENKRTELIKLEVQLNDPQLTRGQRRRLQNKRNKLKAKIKASLNTDSSEQKFAELQEEEK